MSAVSKLGRNTTERQMYGEVARRCLASMSEPVGRMSRGRIIWHYRTRTQLELSKELVVSGVIIGHVIDALLEDGKIVGTPPRYPVPNSVIDGDQSGHPNYSAPGVPDHDPADDVHRITLRVGNSTVAMVDGRSGAALGKFAFDPRISTTNDAKALACDSLGITDERDVEFTVEER